MRVIRGLTRFTRFFFLFLMRTESIFRFLIFTLQHLFNTGSYTLCAIWNIELRSSNIFLCSKLKLPIGRILVLNRSKANHKFFMVNVTTLMFKINFFFEKISKITTKPPTNQNPENLLRLLTSTPPIKLRYISKFSIFYNVKQSEFCEKFET